MGTERVKTVAGLEIKEAKMVGLETKEEMVMMEGLEIKEEMVTMVVIQLKEARRNRMMGSNKEERTW